MKKAYLLLVLCFGFLTACAYGPENSNASIGTVLPTPASTSSVYTFITKNANHTYKHSTKRKVPNCRFLIERATLRNPGKNITVDDALSLLIEQLSLPNTPTSAFKFVGYEISQEGPCYLISYGTLIGTNFTESSRYAVSYSKTIYKVGKKKGQAASLNEVYTVEDGIKGYHNQITASIESGTLTIMDSTSKKTISSFSLAKYGLKDARNTDITLIDMNFDGYLDVAIRSHGSDTGFTYHGFLYTKKANQFSYEIAYSYLPSPEYDASSKKICCSTIHKDDFVYDTYGIVNDQPEICKRITYHYEKEKKTWRMEQYKGQFGELILENTADYTSQQVSEQTGQELLDD